MSGLGSRAEALERLATTPLDVLVVGGGITGAGIALDASSRGLSVGLVERRDFASGTSSKSSKLVHGGLRYLEQREFGLMREAATERDLLRRLAPHLVEPIAFVLPVSDRWKRAMFGVGLWAYDALASFRNVRGHKYLAAEETETLVPPLRRGKIKGGYLFYDCKTDDVRLVMEVLIQARRYGTLIANYARVEHLDEGRAEVVDELTGESFAVTARNIIVAAGVWTDEVEALANSEATPRVRPSKGVHLVFSREALPMAESAAFIPDAERKRMLFVIPWIDGVLVGTTDTPFEGDIDAPIVDEQDRTYCIDAVNSVFGLSLTEHDVVGAYAGLRPLIAGRAGATADLSRKHAVYDIAPGIIGITGGKLTTWRRMAIDAVDRVADGVKSKTRWIRLGSSDLTALGLAVDRRAKRLGISDAAAANLIRCYGDRALRVLDLAASEDLVAPLAPGRMPLAAEAVYCARSEMAVHLADLLARRTRLSLTDRAGGLTGGVVDLMAGEHGWSRRHRGAEVDAYRAETEGERGMELDIQSRPPSDIQSA